MKEIRETSEIGKWENCPIILPESFVERRKGEVSDEKLQALKDGKCVFIEGFWTILSKNLPVKTKL